MKPTLISPAARITKASVQVSRNIYIKYACREAWRKEKYKLPTSLFRMIRNEAESTEVTYSKLLGIDFIRISSRLLLGSRQKRILFNEGGEGPDSTSMKRQDGGEGAQSQM